MKIPRVIASLSAWPAWQCYGLLGLALMLLASGCDSMPRRQERDAETLPPDFRAALPAGWEPLAGWREVNIDGDAARWGHPLLRRRPPVSRQPPIAPRSWRARDEQGA